MPPFLICLARAALAVGVAVGLAGCAAPMTVAPRPAAGVAHVALINFTGRAWLISLRAAGGGEVRSGRIAAAATIDLPLSAGDYVIEQTLLASDGAVAATRQLAVHFDAGERYRWPLATLLSDGNTAGTGAALAP